MGFYFIPILDQYRALLRDYSKHVGGLAQKIHQSDRVIAGLTDRKLNKMADAEEFNGFDF